MIIKENILTLLIIIIIIYKTGEKSRRKKWIGLEEGSTLLFKNFRRMFFENLFKFGLSSITRPMRKKKKIMWKTGRTAVSVLQFRSVNFVNISDQRIVIFPANRNRNRFTEPTSVQIGIGIVWEFQNMRIGIGIIFVRWEVFANNS